MKIAICDDEKIMRNEVESLVRSFNALPAQFETAHFDSGEQLEAHYTAGGRADIIFLDIEMGKSNGIETAEKIRALQRDAIIIFISSHRGYVFDAFRVEALHFILKPIDKYEFDEVFTRAINKHHLLNSYLSFKWENDRRKIAINDIIYIESYNRRLSVHTVNDVFDTTGKMNDLAKTLETHGFLRIHQGFLVNMNYIRVFDKTNVSLTNGETVMISVRKRSEALKAFDRYLRKWKW